MEHQTKLITWADIMDEIWYISILSQLSLADLKSITIVCKKFKMLVIEGEKQGHLYLWKINEILKKFIIKTKNGQKCGLINANIFLKYKKPKIVKDTIEFLNNTKYKLPKVFKTNGEIYGNATFITKTTWLTMCKDKFNLKNKIYKIYPKDMKASLEFEGSRRITITEENTQIYTNGDNYFFVDINNEKMEKMTYINDTFESKFYNLIGLKDYTIKFVNNTIILQNKEKIIIYDYENDKIKHQIDMLQKFKEKYNDSYKYELYIFEYEYPNVTFCLYKTIAVVFGSVIKLHNEIVTIGYVNANSGIIKFIETNDILVVNGDFEKYITNIDNVNVKIIDNVLIYINTKREYIKFYNKDTLELLELSYKIKNNDIIDFTDTYFIGENNIGDLLIYNYD